MLDANVAFVFLFSDFYVCMIIFLIAYIIGSIPTGYIVVKVKTGRDIRKIGSGSTGATNVKRVLGVKWFFTVMLLDAFKGFLPVFLAKFVTLDASIGLLPVIAAVAVIIGHSKPLFLKFKGGKSVATGIGTIIALNWLVGIIVAVIWTAVTYTSRYVSVGSIVAVISSPILMLIFKEPIAYVIYCALGAIYIIYLHKDNIGRLLLNQENKIR